MRESLLEAVCYVAYYVLLIGIFWAECAIGCAANKQALRRVAP